MAVTEGVLLAPVLVTTDGAKAPLRGGELGQVGIVRDAVLAWRDGLITYAGPAEGFPGSGESMATERAQGLVLAGFVDCHTHLPFVGWRADEFEARLAGKTYRDLHGGGGIYRSARLMAEASDEDVV